MQRASLDKPLAYDMYCYKLIIGVLLSGMY